MILLAIILKKKFIYILIPLFFLDIHTDYSHLPGFVWLTKELKRPVRTLLSFSLSLLLYPFFILRLAYLIIRLILFKKTHPKKILKILKNLLISKDKTYQKKVFMIIYYSTPLALYEASKKFISKLLTYNERSLLSSKIFKDRVKELIKDLFF